MIHWGINALNHGSSLAVFKDGKYLSGIVSNNDILPQAHFDDAIKEHGMPDRIFWYERPWVKKTRQAFAGQWSRVFDFSVLPSRYLKRCGLGNIPITYTPHHASHAAAGYYTCPFEETAIIVLDAIGEWECATIWQAKDGNMQLLWSKNYPNSLGLFYSAFTDLLGLIPVRDEYKLQDLAKYGDYKKYLPEVKSYVWGFLNVTRNLHKGVQDWPYPITEQDRADIAASVQYVFEDQIKNIMTLAKNLTGSKNLVYMGGCAMNSAANKLIENRWDQIWSLPNPGDPSSSIGAVLYHTKERITWKGGVVKHIQIKYN